MIFFLFSFPGRSTMFAFQQALTRILEELDCPGLPYDLFRQGWLGYVTNLKFDLKEAFRCDKCGDAPEIVLFDATLLACRKDLLFSTPAVELPLSQTGSKHADRVLLPRVTDQTIMASFTATTAEKPWDDATGLDDLPDPLQSVAKHCLVRSDDKVHCDPKWAKFLGEMSKSSAVCSALPPSCHDTIRCLISPQSPTTEQLLALADQAPLLADLLKNVKATSLPQWSHAFFLHLIILAGAPFTGTAAPHHTAPAEVFTDLFPSLPLQRARGKFTADKKAVRSPTAPYYLAYGRNPDNPNAASGSNPSENPTETTGKDDILMPAVDPSPAESGEEVPGQETPHRK